MWWQILLIGGGLGLAFLLLAIAAAANRPNG